MLVRGAGEGFNVIVPIRRIQDWCEDVDMKWAIDDSQCPTLNEVLKMRVEDSAMEANIPEKSTEVKPVEFPFLIQSLELFD